MAAETRGLTRFLERTSPAVFAAYATFASFSAYLCMYAFRKPFAAASFSGETIGALDAKSAYVIAQVLGYAASKFLGIKVVSELEPGRRARSILLSVVSAEAALVLFAVLPKNLALVAIALNGLSLGMVWGMVFGFLEGRKTSDFLGAGLCASFIVGSGIAKSVGKAFLGAGVSERWMPALTGICALPLMVVFVWMLSKLPPPSAADIATRTKRAPMGAEQRRAFFRSYAVGLVVLVLAYVLLTALRDFRDNFAVEIWKALGYGEQPSILTTTELPVAAGALAGVAAIGVFASNKKALLATHGLVGAGAILVGGSTLLHQAGLLGPIAWMIAVGLGLYLAYVPYNCVLFDRLVAAAGSTANAGFLIYVADASGYAGSVATLLYKNFGQKNLSWVAFLEGFSLISSVAILAAAIGSAFYFHRRLRPA